MSRSNAMSAHYARGHFDGRAPSMRIVLFAQDPPRYQGVLFASPAIEPNSEPPCDHPETQQQRRLTDPRVLDDVCVLCGRVVNDGEVFDGD